MKSFAESVTDMKRVKRFVARPLLNVCRKLAVDIQIIYDLDIQINKLRSIKSFESRLSAAKELVLKHPKHPNPHFELLQCMHYLSDTKEFEQMDRYAEVRREWLIQTGLEELDLEFIWPGIVMGSLGNHYAIEGLLKANRYGLRPAKKPFLLLNQDAQLRNPALFEYFEHHLCVIRDREAVQSMKRLESLLTLPLGFCLPLHQGCPFLDIAANITEMERETQSGKLALFQLSDLHREMGIQVLKQLGMSEDAWYVTLHVREAGYRGETPQNSTQNFRNVNPLDYLKAIETVTKAGGWVFRMGDTSMTPLPSMPQVIDYAHHEIRSDWMDVFLGATCQFCIGTGSGYYHIPMFFGKPILFTNSTGFHTYFGLRNQDIYLPRLLKNFRTNELVSFEQYMSPPTGMFSQLKVFRDAELHWVENTPEELESATQEMLECTTGNTLLKPDNDLQRCFKATAEACGLKYGGRPVKAFASISRDFLVRHAHLLESRL